MSLKEQRRNEKRDRVIDLTHIVDGENIGIGDHNRQPTEGETIKTYFNDDGSIKYKTSSFDAGTARSYRSKVNTQSDKSKKSGIHSKLSSDSEDTDTTPMIRFVNENGIKTGPIIENEYEKHNPDAFADKMIGATGATILHSEVTLTDASGNKQTFVRRKDNTDYY